MGTRLGIVAFAALVLAGCAHAPNAPGTGYGDAYTPLVDTQGLDMARYSADLDSCRSMAKQINANQQEMQGMIGGAILGAALGAALGGGSRFNQQMAVAGGGGGLAGAGVRARGKQENVLANCMAGRGYRVLDVNVVTNAFAPSPYTAASPQGGTLNAAPAATIASPPPAASYGNCRWVTAIDWKCN
jgi:outer membrane lipoprotein SlyB